MFKHKNTVIKEMHLQVYIIVIVYLSVYSIFKNGAVETLKNVQRFSLRP